MRGYGGRTRTGWLAAGIATLLAGCAERPGPAPAARPAPRVVQVTPPPQPPPAPAPADWRDLPLSQGEWRYARDDGGSTATFGRAGLPGFVLRCDPGRREILVSRTDTAGGGAVTVRTSYGSRRLSGEARIAASDTLFDEIAFSRGRFTVESEGQAMLVIPAWAEPARVVEDCRS